MVMLQYVRNDALPEGSCYPDEGCDAYPQCLACPFPRCRYDSWHGMAKMRAEKRDAGIVALRREGVTVDEVAERFGVCRRTVFRVSGEPQEERRKRWRETKRRQRLEA